jgi:hypothetical protein
MFQDLGGPGSLQGHLLQLQLLLEQQAQQAPQGQQAQQLQLLLEQQTQQEPQQQQQHAPPTQPQQQQQPPPQSQQQQEHHALLLHRHNNELLLRQHHHQEQLERQVDLEQAHLLQIAAVMSAAQQAQSGSLLFQLAPAPLHATSSGSWGGELEDGAGARNGPDRLMLAAAERRRSIAAAAAAAGVKAPRSAPLLPNAFAMVEVGPQKPPPRQERVEGMVYVVKGEKKRWVGARRFIPCCKYPNCDKLQQGQSAYCKKHGGGWRCEIQGCTSAARGSFKFCFAHGGRKDNVVPTMPKSRHRRARDTQPVQQETYDSEPSEEDDAPGEPPPPPQQLQLEQQLEQQQLLQLQPQQQQHKEKPPQQ